MRHKSGTRVLGMYNGLSEPVSLHWCLPVLSLQSWANDILYKERSYSVQHASVTVQTYFKISFVNIFLFLYSHTRLYQSNHFYETTIIIQNTYICFQAHILTHISFSGRKKIET